MEKPGLQSRINRGSFPFGVAAISLLVVVSLVLVFAHGAYVPADWLPLVIVLALVAGVICAWAPLPRLTSSQRILLSLFFAQAVWTAASILWASSRADAWQETNRTLFYLLALSLVVAAVRWTGPKALTWLVMGLVGVQAVMAVVIVLRLGLAADPLRFFADGRLNYPITYWNGLSAFLMVGFWLSLGMANEGVGARWLQGLLLAWTVVLVELALLPQSRGAIWAFFLVLPFFVILSPHRFRALANMVAVLVPVIIFWRPLSAVYLAARDRMDVHAAISIAIRDVGLSVLIVLGIWVLSRLVERRLSPLNHRTRFWLGVVLLAIVCMGLAVGLVVLNLQTQGLGELVQRAWVQVTSDSGPSVSDQSRFADLGLNGRLAQWRVAAAAFVEHPVLGLGAQNFEIYWYQHRAIDLQVLQPHSQPMQLLSELGIVGALIWAAFAVWTVVRGVLMRFRAKTRAERAILSAILTAVIYWLIHSSVDWLWQLAAVSLPAVLLLGGLVAARSQPDKREGDEQGASRARRLGPKGRFRLLAAILACLILVSAALPYLAIRYGDLAAANITIDPQLAVDSAQTAGLLDRLSSVPAATEAAVFASSAQQSKASPEVAANELAFAVAAWQEAVTRAPHSWLVEYRTARAILDYRDAVAVLPPFLFTVAELLVSTPALSESASSVHSLSFDELTALAKAHFEKAGFLNPLNLEIQEVAKRLETAKIAD